MYHNELLGIAGSFSDDKSIYIALPLVTCQLKKGCIMKIWVALIAVLFSLIVPAGRAQEYGKIRPLNQRAAFVVKLKHDYIDRVLASHHERNDNGTVVHINIDGQ